MVLFHEGADQFIIIRSHATDRGKFGLYFLPIICDLCDIKFKFLRLTSIILCLLPYFTCVKIVTLCLN